MPGKTGASLLDRRRSTRLSRSSSFTDRVRERSSEKALLRSSPRVRGRLMIGTPGIKTFLIIRRGSLVAARCEVTIAQRPEGLFHIGIVYGYKKAGRQ